MVKTLFPVCFKSRLVLLFLIILAACSEQENSASISLKSYNNSRIAVIGDSPITDFMIERELKFGIEKKVEPKQLFNWKIYEHTIAQSLRSQGFDQEAAFLDASKAFKHEAYVEEVFQINVTNKIVVTKEEIQTEVAKRNVKFAFRFIPVENEQDGVAKRNIWLNTSYDSLVKISYSKNQEIAALSQQWQSPLVEAYDIDASLLTQLQNLEIGVPSQPILYNGKWMLFEVTDIRRKPIGDWENDELRFSAEKVVWNKKAIDNASTFVDSLMKPLAVRTNASVLKQLSSILYPLFKTNTPIRSLAYLMQYDAFYKEQLSPLKIEQNQVLSSWKGGKLTVYDFLVEWVPGVYPLRFDSKESFDSALSDAIALLIRDKKLIKLASKNKSFLSDSLSAELRLKEDKWLFQQHKNKRLNQLLADSTNLAQWYDKQSEKRGLNAISFDQLNWEAKNKLAYRMLAEELKKEADSLAQHIEIIKFDEAWAQLERSLIKEAENERNTKFKTVQLFKNYANRPAWPAIDAIWLQLPS